MSIKYIFCGKRDAQSVLVLYKYCPYFREFVGICFNLILMWRLVCCYNEKLCRNP